MVIEKDALYLNDGQNPLQLPVVILKIWVQLNLYSIIFKINPRQLIASKDKFFSRVLQNHHLYKSD